MQDGPELFVCRLTPGVQEFANLDLVLDEYTELTCVGAPIHVTGTALVIHLVSFAVCLPGLGLPTFYKQNGHLHWLHNRHTKICMTPRCSDTTE